MKPKLKFLYSKAKEKEKLLNIREEYQWFIDNDFPIILPKFYIRVYQKNKNNKKIFIRDLDKELDEIYKEGNYQVMLEKIKDNWQKNEKAIFFILEKLGLRLNDKYFCYISLYGPQGQFKRPNIISLRTSSDQDIKESNETITHELIHLLIYDKSKRLKLDYKQIEGLVDLFFAETELRNIFPQYRLQSSVKHNKEIFDRVLRI